MKKLSFFIRTFFLLVVLTTPLACGSDDNGGEIPAAIDVEASYAVNDPKEVGDYTDGESLASVSDADGAITSASLGSGSTLPAGMALNSTTGELTVSDIASLASGTFSLEITTEDAKGGTTEHNVSIIINVNADSDAAATYTITEAKAAADYVMGESIATVSDADGDIVGATLESGTELPAGTALNATTGEITVEDATLLTPGSYDVEISTEDVNGGTTMHTVTLIFNENLVIVNINSGGDELVFTDITFAADQFFVGTSMPFSPDPLPAIDNTDRDELYVTERFGTDFGYEIELENGTYKVTLHFVELYWGAPGLGSAGGTGDRVFDVSLEDVVVIDDYDIFADVGALFATTQEFEVILTDGMLNVDFLSSVDNAKLSALEVEKIN